MSSVSRTGRRSIQTANWAAVAADSGPYATKIGNSLG